MVLGGFINAIRRSGVAVKDHKAVFFGAGSAGVGVAKQIVAYFMQEGLKEEEARRKFWFVDTKGLVTNDRGDKLAEHKVYFARLDNDGKQYKTLSEVVHNVKPTILMGLSTMPNTFTAHLLTNMAQWNQNPIIFPLSNPSDNSECTFEDAVKYTNGKALFASGSPFDPVVYRGETYYAGQGKSFLTSFLPTAHSVILSMKPTKHASLRTFTAREIAYWSSIVSWSWASPYSPPRARTKKY